MNLNFVTRPELVSEIRALREEHRIEKERIDADIKNLHEKLNLFRSLIEGLNK